MLLIQQLTASSLQQLNIQLPDGTIIGLEIYFRPMQFGWFINSLTYGTFVTQGLRITNNPNLLNQYRNVLPFGLACFSTANREPSQQQDFSSGNSKLYILTSDEVKEYTEYLEGG